MRPGRNPRFRFFYIAAIVFGGILTHLMSEFAGMGQEADTVLFSTRHLYLLMAVIVCAMLAIREIHIVRALSSSQRDFKRVVALNLDTLPLKGWGFFGAMAAAQFSVGVVSAVGEGCFFCGHDVIAALIGALATVLLLAFTARLLAARLPSIAAALVYFVQAVCVRSTTPWTSLQVAPAPFDRFYWFSSLFNRPPPLPQF